MQSLKKVATAAMILAVFPASTLFGQNRTPTAPGIQRGCPPDVAPTPRSGETTGSPPLSERLSESKGVICPPTGVDPGIVNKPPSANAPMPVIPPPGTPGGDPGTQPK
jgi:hypothetical protein